MMLRRLKWSMRWWNTSKHNGVKYSFIGPLKFFWNWHHNEAKGAGRFVTIMVSQITGNWTVCSTICSANNKENKSATPLPLDDFPHKDQVMGESGIHIFTSSCVNYIIKRYSHNVSVIITPNKNPHFRSRQNDYQCLIAKAIKFNSLWPSDVIWWHRSGSTLPQVIACCLTAPSHYLNQCQLIISKFMWHSSGGNLTRGTTVINNENKLENYSSKI